MPTLLPVTTCSNADRAEAESRTEDEQGAKSRAFGIGSEWHSERVQH